MPSVKVAKMTEEFEATEAIPTDAATATDRDGWLAIMDRIGEDAGYFTPLGARHWAFFVDESPTLVVTFETVEAIRARPGQMPLGHEVAKARGWSHLCLISDGQTWYRDPAVYGYFDRLVDDAFFEDFDRVVFHGADAGGYAACAFSVAAPGATVLAISPRATLSPAQAGWDGRHRSDRRLDFTTRYGFAPAMIEGTGQVFVIHDPGVVEDAMHAALFNAPFVTHLRTPHLDGRVDWALSHLHLTETLIASAAEGTLSRLFFARAWRARRNFGPYLRGILARAQAGGHPQREAMICRSVTQRLNAPRFKRRLAELDQASG